MIGALALDGLLFAFSICLAASTRWAFADVRSGVRRRRVRPYRV